MQQQVGGELEEEQDLTELRNMHAQMWAELPKKSRVPYNEECWERASWDVFPTRNITQLWRRSPSVVPVLSQMASALSPDEVQSYLEQWVNMPYAFHWGHRLARPLLVAHRNHQQEAILLRWEGLVAGTDGSVDERTECIGAGTQ